MELENKELQTIKDLQTQEKACIEKYSRYKRLAKDNVLKELFDKLSKKEQKHYDSLQEIVDGNCPSCDCNDEDGKNYNPEATYSTLDDSDDKLSDSFLVTDCISSEKLVSSEYNSDVFNFKDSCIRKLLADIMIEEQNHAEMLYKYKTVNGMA